MILWNHHMRMEHVRLPDLVAKVSAGKVLVPPVEPWPLEVFEDGEWSDWYDAEGNGIDDVADELLAPPKPEQKPKRVRGRRVVEG